MGPRKQISCSGSMLCTPNWRCLFPCLDARNRLCMSQNPRPTARQARPSGISGVPNYPNPTLASFSADYRAQVGSNEAYKRTKYVRDVIVPASQKKRQISIRSDIEHVLLHGFAGLWILFLVCVCASALGGTPYLPGPCTLRSPRPRLIRDMQHLAPLVFTQLGPSANTPDVESNAK
jgi:hypothetical protein